MTTNFDSIQTLKSSENCNKFSKSVSYETLVGGTATTGMGIKQIRRLFLSSADKPLSAVGTLTSLLCNSAKVKEKLLRHVITRRTSVRRVYLPEQGTHANEESLFASVTWLMILPRRIQRMLLRMTIPTLVLLLSLNLSPAFSGTTCNWDGTKLTIDGSGTFNGCPDNSQTTATEVIIGTGVTSIGYAAFMGAKSLTSITIPKGVKSIGDGAFYGASSLTSITIPDSVTSIGPRAFYNTSSLTSITIPDSVTSIGYVAFAYTGLTSITIPEGVKSIGWNAFEGASSLESIIIPEGVTSIGNSAFYGATDLKSIIIPDNVNTANWSANVFYHFPEGTNIVCQGDVEKCKKALAKFGGNGNCTVSYCINSDLIVAADESQCTSTNYYWSGSSCNNKKNGIICAEKWKRNEDFCNRIRYTPAEAAEVLTDDNNNSVTITFKK